MTEGYALPPRNARRLAAAAIRRHLWQPWHPGPHGGRPWTMGRELEIFDRLSVQHDPLDLVGAIAFIRPIAGTDGPARLTWLIHPQRGAALLTQAKAAFHASEPTLAPPGPPRGGGLHRIAVELPPHNRQSND